MKGKIGSLFVSLTVLVSSIASSGAYAATNGMDWTLHSTTALSKTDSNFTFDVGDYNHDGYLDLYCVKKQGTTSTEVHILDGKSGYQRFLLQTGTPIEKSTKNYEFKFGDYNHDGNLDLYCIKKQGANSTEVHILDGASNFQKFLLHTAIPIEKCSTNFDFELGDYNNDGNPDLYCIKKQGAKSTEVHILNGANNFQSFLYEISTPIENCTDNFDFGVRDFNNDGHQDLYCIKRNGAQKTEIHILSGSDSYQRFLLQSATPLDKCDSSIQCIPDPLGRNIFVVMRNGATGTELHEFNLPSTISQARVNLLNRINNGSYGSRWNGPDQCKGFARKVFQDTFGISVNSTASNNYQLLPTSGVDCLGTIVAADSNQVKALIQKAQPGDFMQMCWNSHHGPHSAILVSSDANGFTFFSANMDGNNGICENTYSYSDYANRISQPGNGLSIYSATGK